MSPTGEHVTITEIVDLLAWARHLSAATPSASSPAERAEFHAAKADLLARLEDQHISHTGKAPNPRKDIR